MLLLYQCYYGADRSSADYGALKRAWRATSRSTRTVGLGRAVPTLLFYRLLIGRLIKKIPREALYRHPADSRASKQPRMPSAQNSSVFGEKCIVMTYVGVAYTVMAYKGMACALMAYVTVAYNGPSLRAVRQELVDVEEHVQLWSYIVMPI